ncbi:MAG: AmmeMemoRadiSam system radical SAM enzyme [bacterium]|nr:AmmeMemoRadiSam system radical SAM enzyme [bacterium]
MTVMRISRREFLARAGLGALSLGLPRGAVGAEGNAFAREAMHYGVMDGGAVACRLCPRGCVVAEGMRGHCGVRENRGGRLRTLVFGRACTAHNDPIEKKPLFHFLPGTTSFSIATAGCNIECKFCQNWQISQARPEEVSALDMPPDKVVDAAVRAGSASIAYTYTEPVIFYEYMLETAKAGKARGMRSVMITNGFIQREPMRALIPELAAVKVDLKAFTDTFYREVCDGRLQPVLDTLLLLKRAGIWHEIVVLLVPTLNDGEKEIRDLCAWVKAELGPDVPLHFTRYHPTYKIRNIPPTPVSTIEKARSIGMREGLRFVYAGNVPGHPGEHTRCPGCGATVISRISYHVDASGLKDGACRSCGRPIPGVWA